MTALQRFGTNGYNLLKSMRDFWLGASGDVTTEWIEEDDSVASYTFGNRAKFMYDLSNTVAGEMNKTFYVDSLNGNDINSGTTASPFATIKKAVDSVPNGAYGYILLKDGVHTLTQDIFLNNKRILIYGNSTDNSLVTIKQDYRVQNYLGTDFALSYGLYLRSSDIKFAYLKIEGLINNSGLSVHFAGGLIKRDDTTLSGSFNTFICNIKIGDEPIIITASGSTSPDVKIYAGTVDMVGSVDKPLFFLQSNSAKFDIQDTSLGTKSDNATPITVPDLITGVVRGVDGDPLNVLSHNLI